MDQFIVGVMMTLLLGISTWLDIKRREVSGKVLICFTIIGIISYVVKCPFSILSMAGGILIGAFVMGVSKLTKGNIGMGDGLLLCVTGVYLGFYRNLELFLTALCAAAIWGMILIVLKKAGRKTELPFVPFMLMAYIIMLLL